MRAAQSISLLAATGSLLLAAAVHAGADPGNWYVSPEAVWVSPDNKLGGTDDTGYRFGIGRVFNQNWDGELAYAETKHSAGVPGPAGDLKLAFSEVLARRVFNRSVKFNPFVDFGLGVTHVSLQGTSGSSSELGGKLGVGFLYGRTSSPVAQLVATAGLRLDRTNSSSSAVDPYVGLGFHFYLGGAKPVAAAPPPPPPPPPVVQVAPPPRPAPVAAPPPPPPPVVDTDGDGVPDGADRCPRTPRGDKVDAVGCGLKMELKVLFDNDSANIKPESYGELDAFVAFLKAVPSASGTLEGHTDSVGKDAYNQKLSERRAESVQTYVVGKGIAASRVVAHGFGESQPVADNKTPEGRALNRRVLFTRTSLQQ